MSRRKEEKERKKERVEKLSKELAQKFYEQLITEFKQEFPDATNCVITDNKFKFYRSWCDVLGDEVQYIALWGAEGFFFHFAEINCRLEPNIAYAYFKIKKNQFFSFIPMPHKSIEKLRTQDHPIESTAAKVKFMLNLDLYALSEALKQAGKEFSSLFPELVKVRAESPSIFIPTITPLIQKVNSQLQKTTPAIDLNKFETYFQTALHMNKCLRGDLGSTLTPLNIQQSKAVYSWGSRNLYWPHLSIFPRENSTLVFANIDYYRKGKFTQFKYYRAFNNFLRALFQCLTNKPE